jgi:hypothetical protein
MVTDIKKWFSRQNDGLQSVLKLGEIAQLSTSGTWITPYFKFNLVNQNNFSGIDTSWIDFSNYEMQIKLRPGSQPRVIILRGLDGEKPPHTYLQWNLCLYHPSENIWSNEGDFSQDILPLVYTWVYFYEVWQITGEWYGREWKH